LDNLVLAYFIGHPVDRMTSSPLRV